jgi:hypothetical protein
VGGEKDSLVAEPLEVSRHGTSGNHRNLAMRRPLAQDAGDIAVICSHGFLCRQGSYGGIRELREGDLTMDGTRGKVRREWMPGFGKLRRE